MDRNRRRVYDLNFWYEDGINLNATFENISITDISGINGARASCVSSDADIGARYNNLTCRETLGMGLGNGGISYDFILSNFDFRDLSNAVTPTGAVGIDAGPHAYGGLVDAGVMANISGSNCIDVRDGTDSFTINNVTMHRCGNIGIGINDQNRNIMMRGVFIDGTGGNGIHINTVAATARNINLVNSTVRGTADYGVAFESADANIQFLTIRGNRFENIGETGS